MAAYRLRRIIAAVLGASIGAPTLFVTSAAASSTPLAFAGAKQLHILCNVTGDPGMDQAALSRQLCEQVRRAATPLSPLAVDVITLGDPAVLAADAVTLLVHASVSRRGSDRLLAFTIRPYRVSDQQAAVLFGAAPRAVAISANDVAGPAVRSAIGLALAEALPWRGARGIRPIQ